jgi:1-acyl-sn-glycerol-3-phosphate acyltransferase
MRRIAGPLDYPVYVLARVILMGTLAVLYRLRVQGAEHVPETGAVVLASNHISNIDPLFVGVACPRQVRFMAKVELWKFAPFGWLLQGLGAFPVRRGEADREAVRRGLKVVESGAVLGIFPEGHRQRSGKLGQPQSGLGLFSLKEGAVTIPVVITGSNRIIRDRRLHFPKVSVTFGPPVDLNVSADKPRSQRHQEAGSRTMAALAGMLGQEWKPEPDQSRDVKDGR